ncbi:SslE/AcfD family lipoprotein zinc metalloprotease [Aliivibrio sp. 1S128]|uniref:SslE/AcfD family lipoprotein zinc metalloprotease n=1 Tax=Aliivibrio sp. 1S128 TaxID=1840085 RepID=UPI00080DD649|nr:SslE/AcfD family lipoprotein zinc metalloprotease [Aliivibrio sp. 1S128]OCH15802.1 sugar ABC transporter substrate-binding protein [Aliivibrio sp. 1S128]
MSKKLLLASLISMLLVGCNQESIEVGGGSSTKPETIPPTDIIPPEPEPIPPTDIIPPVTYTGTLVASGKAITGDVECNGIELGTNSGTFSVKQGVEFSCLLDDVILGTFKAPFPSKGKTSGEDFVPHSFDVIGIYGKNATSVLISISDCKNTDNICLFRVSSDEIRNIYNETSLKDEEVVKIFVSGKATDEIGKAPSSHVDSLIVPEVTPGTSNDLNSGFVSASAENSYAYKPSAEAKVLTKSQLTDNTGTPLVGVNFFSANAVGITDENGNFEYLWGDKLTFGIDTFEFGSVTGNQVSYKITDVSDNAVVKANIQSLITRYAENNNNGLLISDKVQETFSLYPNVINELINLSLPNGGKIEGTEFLLPNEFDSQFQNGLTAAIDAELQQQPVSFYSSDISHVFSLDNGTYVTDSLTKIFSGVTSFHVFNDNGSFYGATGYTRGMRALNLSNQAFPIMMPRADINKDIPFGEQQAWTREGRPYIAVHPTIEMPQIPLVSKDNATFGFPFVTAGEIGSGKVVFMGNSMYPSIISCPDNYWAHELVRIDSEAQKCTSSFYLLNDVRNDQGSMGIFFSNLFTWLNGGHSIKDINVATNITKATLLKPGTSHGTEYDFFVNRSFGFSPSVKMLTKDGFSGRLSASETPLLILQAYPPKPQGDGMSHRFIADLENPNLSQDDITALITYINEGGSVVFMDAIDRVTNPEPIGRLADSAGVSLGGSNVTPTSQAFCGSSYYCQAPSPNLHVKSQYEMVVLERFQDVDGQQPYTVNQDGSVEWTKDETKIKFEIPTYEMIKRDDKGAPLLDKDGVPIVETKFARIFVQNGEERAAAISELQAAFKGTPLCTHSYEYEFNCIETRQGDGIETRGAYGRADFDRYQMSQYIVESMVKAANLGDNFNALMEHELYYRTKGKQGTRLSTVELNQTYDNLSIWMWNDNPYAYDSNVQDELGFKTAVGFLNCYTNNAHGNGLTCPDDLATKLIGNGMIHGEGELLGQMNPSYPLNYMEKPLTRIMLGRSFWDHEITVDTTKYPGRTVGATTSEAVNIETAGKAVSYSAGNNQSTGLWAPQLSEVTVRDGVTAMITVMMADDLTGKPQHETSLNRPPRMQMSFAHDGYTTTFKVPYGGLIYIKPTETLSGTSTVAEFNLDGVEKSAWWKKDPASNLGEWVNTPDSSTAPIAEIDTGSFIYTTALNNVKTVDLNEFSKNMNRFADAASDFYGRDEESADGQHRRFTYPELKEFRHRFVNDVQISIGAAHSGYPVMSSSFNADSNKIPTNAIDDWLVWHEVGHNLASAPFSAPGSTEVTNNLLALYMQELEGRNANPEMDRIRTSIQKAPTWLSSNNGHAWSHGDAGLRLVMFGQLKIWAESNFDIDRWYADGETKLAIYNQDQGWNMIKLMHRKARGDKQGDQGINYCSSHDTGLSAGDLMMVCSSYVSGYDLRDFFTTWNVGETSVTNADGTKVYSGGISDAGLNELTRLRLEKPEVSPLNINSLPNLILSN